MIAPAASCLLLLLLLALATCSDTDETCESSVEARYQLLATQLQQATQDNATIILRKSRDSSLIRDQSYKTTDSLDNRRHKLDLSDLNQIISIDRVALTVRVQAKVTMDQLIQYTLGEHSIPAVVPEFKSITVAGAIVGGALESSSFKYGQVSDAVEKCLVLLANGTLVTLSDRHHPDLFHALPGSYGSLGLVLEATIQLVALPTRPLVRLITKIFSGVDGGVEALTEASLSQQHDFLDALYFPDGKLVVIAGDLVSNDDDKLSNISHICMNSTSLWFYEHIEDQLLASEDDSGVFTMSLYDYLFRYDYGAFWMARPLAFSWSALLWEPKLSGPFLMASRTTRALFGPFYTTTNLYRALHQLDATAVAEKFVILDAYLPATNAAKYLLYVAEEIPVTIPIWLCPVKPPLQPQPLSPSGFATADHRMLVNVAVWGRVSDNRGIEYVAEMETKLLELVGRKMLYSQTNMTAEDLYTKHVDGSTYRVLREKYDPKGVFPSLHEKLQLESASKDKRKRGLKHWISRILL